MESYETKKRESNTVTCRHTRKIDNFPECRRRNATRTRSAPNEGILSGMSGIARRLAFSTEGP
jgi:hypothetical protein